MKYKFFSVACAMALVCGEQIWGMNQHQNRPSLIPGSSLPNTCISIVNSPSFTLSPHALPETLVIKNEEALQKLPLKPIPWEKEFSSKAPVSTFFFLRHAKDIDGVHFGEDLHQLSTSDSSLESYRSLERFQEDYGYYMKSFSSEAVRALATAGTNAEPIAQLNEQNIKMNEEALQKYLKVLLSDPSFKIDETAESGLDVLARVCQAFDLIGENLTKSNKPCAFVVSHRLIIYWLLFHYMGGKMIPGDDFQNFWALVIKYMPATKEFKILTDPYTNQVRVLTPSLYENYFKILFPNLRPKMSSDTAFFLIRKLRQSESEAISKLGVSHSQSGDPLNKSSGAVEKKNDHMSS